MATTSTYPATLDVLANPLATDPMNSTSVAHANLHTRVNDALEAVQSILGLNPHGGYATVAARLNNASYAGHTHTVANVTGLQAALDAKAAVSHTHAIANVTGLQTVLNAKSDIGHTHAPSSVTSITGTGTLADDLNARPTIATTTPASLGAAAVGTSTTAARSDHVHPLPTLSSLGAASSATTLTAGAGLTGGGTLGANRTISANLTTSGGNNGTATTVARGDHNHDGVYAKVVPLAQGTAFPAASGYPTGTILAVY